MVYWCMANLGNCIFNIYKQSSRLWNHQFFAKLSKCEFGSSTISYLGHIMSHQGVYVDPIEI